MKKKKKNELVLASFSEALLAKFRNIIIFTSKRSKKIRSLPSAYFSGGSTKRYYFIQIW